VFLVKEYRELMSNFIEVRVVKNHTKSH